jgi:rare lipoprotein A
LAAIAANYFPTEPIASAAAGFSGLPKIFESGIASYYSYECAKSPMANGRPFDPEKRTCASWFYDFGTVLSVQSLDTGRSTHVVVTDRGPNKRLVKKGRVIDLSKRAFEDICDLEKGLTRVIITVKAHR